MSELKPEKLHVRFRDGVSEKELSLPRRYTLTHSDLTGDLFLTIGAEYDRKQIAGFYTRLMRDEVLAEWKREDGEPALHVYCHVSGGIVLGGARWRYDIFHQHMRLVLEALRFGDRECVSAHPEMDDARVIVHFASDRAEYHHDEEMGFIRDYGMETVR